MLLYAVLAVLFVFAVVAAVLIGATLLVCVGPDRLRTATADPTWFRGRLRSIAPFVAGLGFVLAANKGLQDPIQAFSKAYGYDATATLYRIEGEFVAGLQAAIPDWTALYFSVVYVFGYAVLLGFPVVAYLFADSLRPLRTLLTAYALNYAVAVVCYAAVVARGPRSVSGSTDGILLELFPWITMLTAQVNRETNVFPSLHTSMSVTVLLVAVSTRSEFPRWVKLAAVLAGSVLVSTMYLGIHWLIDVVAGVVLALVAVAFARRIVGYVERSRQAVDGSPHRTASDPEN